MRRGVRTKRGSVFGPQRVRDILRNPWYAGKVCSGEELFDGKHDALVPWELFERVGAKLDEASESIASRGGRRPKEATLLGGVMRCAHCGRGLWQRKNESGHRVYICGNVRQANGTCSAEPFDAPTAEQAVVDHLDSLFVDLGAWIERMAEQRANERGALERELAGYVKDRDGLVKDEELVRADYRRQLRDGNEGAARVAATEVEKIEAERAKLDARVADMEACIAEWEGGNSADAVLDWWTEFSAAIRGEVVDADSVRDANAALKERFAAIFVRSEKGGTPRLDFILRERPPGSPIVSSRLWVDDPADLPDDGMLVDFVGEDLGEPTVKPRGSH